MLIAVDFCFVRCIARLVHSADFERVLATRTRSRSTHFALHHVASGPSRPGKSVAAPAASELSTGLAPAVHRPVDDGLRWLGCVVPKRHAKRAVTRSLLKRQMRAAVERHAAALQAGLWVLRLRAPFAKPAFPSAASDALRGAVRAELELLLAGAQASHASA